METAFVITAGGGADLLLGCEAIAAHLGLNLQQVRHRVRTKELPTFKLGRSVCARRSTLAAWLAKREGAHTSPTRESG